MKLEMILTVAIVTVLQSCSSNNVTLDNQLTYRIDKLPTVRIHVNEQGGLDRNDSNKARALIRNLREVESYYFDNSTAIPTNSFYEG